LARTHDHAEAVLTRRDTPDNTGKTPDQKPHRLNDKLSEPAWASALDCQPTLNYGSTPANRNKSLIVTMGSPAGSKTP
jgi:hypothetical protein